MWHIHLLTTLSLVQIIACRMSGTRPSSGSMITFCQFDFFVRACLERQYHKSSLMMGNHWCNTGSSNGLLLSGNKPSPEPGFTQISHWNKASPAHELSSFITLRSILMVANIQSQCRKYLIFHDGIYMTLDVKSKVLFTHPGKWIKFKCWWPDRAMIIIW